MKRVAFSQIHSMNFAITDISVIYQTPTWTTLGTLSDLPQPRKLNGFLLVDKGECLYEWLGGSSKLEHGGLIYLPSGGHRRITVTKREFSFYRICFTVTDLSDGESVVFEKTPCVVMGDAGQALFDLCNRLTVSTLSKANAFRSLSLLSELFALLDKTVNRNEKSRIAPALDHIERHYTEEIEIEQLAQKCFVSQAHLFRLFKEEVGASPIRYRNRLRVERAKVLFRDGECSVGEISSMLGFESIYYFSRVFKSLTGLSPMEYRQQEG